MDQTRPAIFGVRCWKWATLTLLVLVVLLLWGFFFGWGGDVSALLTLLSCIGLVLASLALFAWESVKSLEREHGSSQE